MATVGPMRCDVINGLVIETTMDQLSLLSTSVQPTRVLVGGGRVDHIKTTTHQMLCDFIIYIIRNICSLLYDFKHIFLKIPKNVSFEKTSGRLNRISNYISGTRYAWRSDFDNVNI